MASSYDFGAFETTEGRPCDSCKRDGCGSLFHWKEKDFYLCRRCVAALFLMSAPAAPLMADRACFESLSKEPYNDESLNDIEATCCIDLGDYSEPLLLS